MQNKNEHDIMVSTSGMIYHECGDRRPMLRTTPDTKAERLVLWCRKCKKEIILDIDGLRVKRHSP